MSASVPHAERGLSCLLEVPLVGKSGAAGLDGESDRLAERNLLISRLLCDGNCVGNGDADSLGIDRASVLVDNLAVNLHTVPCDVG